MTGTEAFMRPPAAGRSRLHRLRAALPEGRPLPEAIWRRRHRGMVFVLLAHLVAIFGLALFEGQGALQTAGLLTPLLLAAGVAGAADAPRRLRTAAVALGLLGTSAALVHVTGGATESHLHFFVMLAVITLYQEWLPLLLAIGFVAVHHTVGVLGTRPFVEHGADPVVWAGVHGLYAVATALAGILTWRLNEQERNRAERILHSTVEGIYGVDAGGTITFANEAMARTLGRPLDRLVGHTAHEVCGHPEPTGATCPVCEALSAGDGVPCTGTTFRRVDGTVFPVEFTSVRLLERGRANGAVVSFRDLTEHEELTERALRDGLTGLPNRALFMDHLAKALARLERSPNMAAVMFIDLDRFKVVNDSMGHAAGDALLVAAAERLTASVRTPDTVARFGGDEFVVLCENLVEERDVVTVAERIVDAFTEPFTIQGVEVSANVSVGVTVTRDARVRPDALVRDADAAMYRAKDAGRGRFEMFDEGMRARAVSRLQTESDLWRAIARDELLVHYQPKIDLRDGRVTGVEALVRWKHPEHGILPPAAFIPVAEETGLIVPIGAWVLEEACRRAQVWRAARPELADLSLSVNVSARQLMQPNLVDTVAGILEQTGTPPHLLCLEITESVLMRDVDTTIAALEGVKALGVTIAVDDFGTGYSSLSYLSRFPVDVLKVDRTFVNDIGPSAETWPIVAAVIGLSKALGLATVAEGVESADQEIALRNLGCELAQGFRFAHPQAPEVLDELIAAGQPWVEFAAPPTAADGDPVTEVVLR
jgi:diguanylate cyclase (GGDEF)-like protein/PAS domain S-box-containing protein